MPSGKISKFEVQDGSRKATITLTPATTPPVFKLSDDSDTEFLAMCTGCSLAGINDKTVDVTVTSGAADEIDKLTVRP
jgi:hypothetical protein